LYGHVLLTKDDKPLMQLNLSKKLDMTLKYLGRCKTIPLNKWFYEFAFHHFRIWEGFWWWEFEICFL